MTGREDMEKDKVMNVGSMKARRRPVTGVKKSRREDDREGRYGEG